MKKIPLILLFSMALCSTYNLFPDGGTETLTPTLQWESNNKATSYLIKVGTDGEMGTKVVNERTDGNSFSVGDGVLTSGTKYYWTVDGLDENGESLAGPSNIVSLIMPSINSISLLSPIGDEPVTNLNPTLKWSGLLGVSSYTLQIGTDPELGSLILNTIISGTGTVISDENRLNNSMTYFWQVQGSTEDAVIVSPIGSFSTPASAAITIQSLEDGELISVTHPVFSWAAEEEIAAFSIRFSENAEFS